MVQAQKVELATFLAASTRSRYKNQRRRLQATSGTKISLKRLQLLEEVVK